VVMGLISCSHVSAARGRQCGQVYRCIYGIKEQLIRSVQESKTGPTKFIQR